MSLVIPFGFYGCGNIGDESSLQGFARLTRVYDPDARVWVGSANPSHTARVEPSLKYFRAEEFDPRRWWAKRCASAHVFAGGTPIMDVGGPWPLNVVGAIVAAAQVRRKPVAFVGIGAESLNRQQSKRIVSEVLAPIVVHWSVRSERDKNRLIECKVPADKITTAADLAWMLDPVTAKYGEARLRELGLDPREPIVGVNINHEPHMTQLAPRLFENLAAGLDAIVEKQRVRVIFLCNEVREDEKFDKAASEKVLRAMRHRERAVLVPNEYRSPQQMLSLIACCRATITSRYHFSLFSAVQKVPFLALKRSDKVDDLCWDLHWDYGVALGDLGDASLTEMLAEMEIKRAALVDRLEENAGKMRQRTLKNRMAIAALTKETTK